MAMKRSVHLYVLLAVVGVIYAIMSMAVMGGLVPKALRAADDLAVASGIVLTLAWAVTTFYVGRTLYLTLKTKPKRNKR